MKDKIIMLSRLVIIASIIIYSYFVIKNLQGNFNKYKEKNLEYKILKNNDVLLAYKIKKNWEKYLKNFKKVKNISYKFKIDKNKKLLIFSTYNTNNKLLYNQHTNKKEISKLNKVINSSFKNNNQIQCHSLVFQTFFKNGWKINYQFYVKNPTGKFQLLNSFTINNCIKMPFNIQKVKNKKFLK